MPVGVKKPAGGSESAIGPGPGRGRGLRPSGIIPAMQGMQLRESTRRLVVLGTLALLAYLLYRVVEPVLASSIWAVILGMALWPLYRRVRRQTPRPWWLAPTLVTSALTVGVFVPLVLMGILMVGEMQDLVGEVQERVLEQDGELESFLEGLPLFGTGLADTLNRWRQKPEELQAVLRDNMETMVGLVRRGVTNFGRNLFKVILCIVTVWFVLLHGDELDRQVTRAFNILGGERGEDILRRIRQTVRAVVYGMIMTAIAQALLTVLGFWVAGHDYPLLLGALMFIMSFIPFGPPVIWLPASLSFFLHGEYGWGIATFIWGAGVISTIDNILRPVFIGKATHMPVLLIFVGVIGGVMAFGMVGLFVGPVVVAVALALWMEWVQHFESDPVPGVLVPEAGEADRGALS
jgi:predicted PurR-regulated permease PerM